MDPATQLRRTSAKVARDQELLDREGARLQRRRDDAIRKAAAAGLSRRRIAELTGLSHQRIQQIVSSTR